MTWNINQSYGVNGPRLFLYANGLVVNRGDVVIPSQWSAGTDAGTVGSTAISAYHCTNGGTLGAEPGANWPGAAEDQFPTCGTVTFRSKNIYHVDTAAAVNGGGSQASPFNVASSANATNGRIVLFAKGTTATGVVNLSISGSSANSTHAWVTWYDDGRSVNVPKVGSLTMSNCHWVVIDGIAAIGTGSNNGFTYNQGASSVSGVNVFYRNCTATGMTSSDGNKDGFMLTSSASTDITAKSIWYENCIASNCGGYGFGIEAGNTDQLAAAPITYYNCLSYANGYSKSAWNFGGYARFTTASTGWTRVGGAGTFIYSRSEATTTCRVADHGATFYRQLTSAGATSSPGVGQWGQTGGLLYINLGVDTGTTLTGHTIWWSYNYLDGVTYTNCTSYGGISFNTTSDGSGFGCDTLTAGWVFQRCLATGCHGEGFVSNIALSPSFISCISDGNGTVASGGGFTINNTDTATVSHCVAVNSPRSSGIGAINPNGVLVIKNSIISTNATYGISATGTLTESNNCIYNNTSGAINGSSPAGSDITTNPQLTTSYLPLASTVRAVGATLGGQDYYGVEYPFVPDMGAIRYFATRTVATRTLATRTLATRTLALRRSATV